MYNSLTNCLDAADKNSVHNLNEEYSSNSIPGVKPSEGKKIYLKDEELPGASRLEKSAMEEDNFKNNGFEPPKTAEPSYEAPAIPTTSATTTEGNVNDAPIEIRKAHADVGTSTEPVTKPSCSECGGSFETRQQVLRHMSLWHPPPPPPRKTRNPPARSATKAVKRPAPQRKKEEKRAAKVGKKKGAKRHYDEVHDDDGSELSMDDDDDISQPRPSKSAERFKPRIKVSTIDDDDVDMITNDRPTQQKGRGFPVKSARKKLSFRKWM